MLAQGEIILAKDAGRQDVYCAQVVRDQADERLVNPLVRVVYILQYPIQHAILWPDVPNENPPLLAGDVARLTFVRRCARGEETRFAYEDSLRAALEAALRSAQTEAERAILRRHSAGRFGKRRVEVRQ